MYVLKCFPNKNRTDLMGSWAFFVVEYLFFCGGGVFWGEPHGTKIFCDMLLFYGLIWFQRTQGRLNMQFVNLLSSIHIVSNR